MNLPRLFKLPEYKKFTYRPLFYNPEKEEREARIRDIKAEAGIPSEEGYVPRMQRGAMRSYFKKNATVKKQSNLRLILIIISLLLISYLILFR